MNVDLMKRWMALKDWRDELNQKMREVEADMTSLEAQILDGMAEEGIDSIKINGKNLHIRRRIFASVHDKELAVEALKEAGYGDLVKEGFNTNQLSALLNEFENEGKPLPECFNGVIEPFEKFTLGVRGR